MRFRAIPEFTQCSHSLPFGQTWEGRNEEAEVSEIEYLGEFIACPKAFQEWAD